MEMCLWDSFKFEKLLFKPMYIYYYFVMLLHLVICSMEGNCQGHLKLLLNPEIKDPQTLQVTDEHVFPNDPRIP